MFSWQIARLKEFYKKHDKAIQDLARSAEIIHAKSIKYPNLAMPKKIKESE